MVSPEYVESVSLISVVLIMFVILYTGFMTQRTFNYFRDPDRARRMFTLALKIYHFAVLCQVMANVLLLWNGSMSGTLLRFDKSLIVMAAVSVLIGTVLSIQTVFIIRPRRRIR